MYAIFIILVFGFIACLWIRTWNVTVKPTAQSNQRMAMSHLATYDSETRILTLRGRGAELAKCIKIKNDSDIEVAYEPLTVHVGSATVGGFTTGGVYTTGDYHYISGEKKNGLCRLEYTGCLVAKIQLSESLYVQAKESNINKYLNSEKQIEVIKPKAVSEDELKLAYQLLATTGYAGNDFAKNGFPEYEKCKEIMDWITSTK